MTGAKYSGGSNTCTERSSTCKQTAHRHGVTTVKDMCDMRAAHAIPDAYMFALLVIMAAVILLLDQLSQLLLDIQEIHSLRLEREIYMCVTGKGHVFILNKREEKS